MGAPSPISSKVAITRDLCSLFPSLHVIAPTHLAISLKSGRGQGPPTGLGYNTKADSIKQGIRCVRRTLLGQDRCQEWNGLVQDSMVRYYNFVSRPSRGQVLLSDIETGLKQRFSLSPFVYFSEGDCVRVKYDASGDVLNIAKLLSVAGRTNLVDEADVFPYYIHEESVRLITGTHIPVSFKEVTTDEEFEQLRFLEQFHYLHAKPAWGRQMYLVVRPQVDEVLGTPLPRVLGCVVLTSPSLLSGPRNNLLEWNDREVLKEHVDRVVRIARVIVHPEFRGLHLGSKLVQHAVEYCRERWNVKGKKAWFVETVAEMSRYHPFFERGGLHFIGQTKAHDSAFFFDDDPKKLGIDQGEGQVMASIRRFKQKVHTQKPYLMASLLPADDPLSERIVNASPEPLVADSIDLVQNQLPSPVTFHQVTAGHEGRSVWNEPEELNTKWLQASRKSQLDMEAYMAKLSSLVKDLLHDDLWKSDTEIVGTLLPILRGIDTKVQDSCDSLEQLASAGDRLFADLNLTLDAVVRYREQLLTLIRDSREAIERKIKPINEQAEALRSVEEQLPQHLSKQRVELNDLRLQLQRVEDKLELGAITPSQRWVTDAFGVRPGHNSVTLRDYNLEIRPGSIVLVVGPSGSGKSTMLSLMSGDLRPMEGHVTPENLSEHVSYLDLDFDPSKPLIDLVGRDAQEAIFLLNHVDLAESHLYMKRRDQLSHGQRYRAAFAQMLADRRPVWVADEFCAFLDPVTTLTLCKGIRKLVHRQRITFVAAAAKEDYIRDALQPDIIIRINAGGQVTPDPKSHHWALAPSLEQIHETLTGKPDSVSQGMGRWLRQQGLTEQDPVALAGVRWTKAASDLREVANVCMKRFATALAEHLWARDWVFHRIWNRLRYPEAFSPTEEWAAMEKASQVRYRHELAWALLSLVPDIADRN